MFSVREDSMVTNCPECNGVAEKVIIAPGVMGLNKGPNMSYNGRKEMHFDRYNAYDETKRQYQIWENSGNMSSHDKWYALRHLSKLKDANDRGEIGTVDYGKEGHPIEVDD